MARQAATNLVRTRQLTPVKRLGQARPRCALKPRCALNKKGRSLPRRSNADPLGGKPSEESMGRSARVPRGTPEMLQQLRRHMRLLRAYSAKAFIERDADYFGEVAGLAESHAAPCSRAAGHLAVRLSSPASTGRQAPDTRERSRRSANQARSSTSAMRRCAPRRHR